MPASSTDLYERIERPLVRVLEEMEVAGVKIDREFLDEMRHDLAEQCEQLMGEIHAAAGEEFNVNSTPQLRRDPVREARAHAGEADEDRPVDRRRLAAEDGPGTSTRSWTTCSGTARSRSCATPTPTRCRR